VDCCVTAANEEKAKLQSTVDADRKKFEASKEGVLHCSSYSLFYCM